MQHLANVNRKLSMFLLFVGSVLAFSLRYDLKDGRVAVGDHLVKIVGQASLPC